MGLLPPPKNVADRDYAERLARWVMVCVEDDLLRAVPNLGTYPHAAGRVAWLSSTALLRAKAQGSSKPIAMSDIIPRGELEGLLPPGDIARVRKAVLDPARAPDSEELASRLDQLTKVEKWPTRMVD